MTADGLSTREAARKLGIGDETLRRDIASVALRAALEAGT